MVTSRSARPVRPAGPARLLAVAVACSALLVGCGTDDGTADDPAADDASTSGSPSPDPSSDAPSQDPGPSGPTGAQATWPDCDQVWRDGATLPGSYDGCLEGDEAVKATSLPCSSGQKLLTHDDRFWAVKGGTITETDGPVRQDPTFKRESSVCLA